MSENIHEECGVFGVYSNKPTDVAHLVYFGLYALQHRGQESCGIVVNERGVFKTRKGLGLVNEVFSENMLNEFEQARSAIGHVRYSTTGSVNSENCQPLTVRHVKGSLAIAHNGNLINALNLRREFELHGAIFHTTSDTEVISYAVTRKRLECGSIQEAVERAMYDIKGAYSLVIMSPKKLIAARDPNGFRPLSLGELPDNGGYVIASETCAFDCIGAKFIRDIEPGEIVVVDENGIESIKTHCGKKSSLCVFEFVYFARPDSVIEGASVHKARLRAGQFLARQHPVEADVVIGCPDSGLDAALGYSHESGIPYGVGFIKNRYIGRTFIQPTQGQRENSVKIKLNVLSETVKDKRVVLVDDSIVRGTTSAKVVKLLRNAGAKEIHMRISSPPFISECYFGTDIDSKENLIANHHSVEEIAKIIGADSLGFLSPESVAEIPENAKCGFCRGCFTGNYPVEVPKEFPKDKFEMKFEE